MLRFIGDAVLAIFPISRKNQVRKRCATALKAARLAQSKMAEANLIRMEQGKNRIDFGLGLHMGELLFGNIGTPERVEFSVIGPVANQVARLESEIDGWAEQTPPMTHFVLPGGAESAARLHLARTVCRRAERRVVALGEPGPVRRYLNRLSDWLFALARFENHDAGESEIRWEP